ncbi:MAG: hypothetical protein ACRDOA_15325 [Streptosporangiaceae bacterium]
MNDQELITAVKQSVSGVHMRVPAEQIVSRSRAIRSRRTIPAVAGTLAVAAGAALAVTGTLGSSAPAGHPATAQLAAWTVTEQANGDIKVTIRELRDPAGLQATLRADGVPASVTFAGQQNPACQGYSAGGSQSQRRQRLGSVVTAPAGGAYVLIIHPSAIPSGAGVEIWSGFGNNIPVSAHGLTVELVQASPQCTGS